MPQTSDRRGHTRLDATLLDRFTSPPSWARTVLLRRIGAGALAALGIVVLARDAVAEDHVRIVVAARDLTPGVRLDTADVEYRNYDPSTVPDGTLSEFENVLTHTVAGPVRAGEPLTDVRLLSSRLAESVISEPDARVVPVRLSDAGVTELLRSGDTVDVLTVGEGDDDRVARVLATKAVVVLVSAESAQQRNADRVVLVAMSAEDATAVAAASLVSALTVTFR
ncbi:MAG: SAF domain-containing protein [Rhodococcus sp. (in: high G+C Gram-positive bacteria)]|jgi:Flp pilus assembly protein CpaB|uniref:SAF domain-containing protein n=1 Tax=Rhodococcus sp. EPR-157 TaxID=1813677 RepID=UPI0007BBDAD5|nr:SAF domain-containing protein [Rhodococcus sp. EPR-157]KZF03805.1 hypothetical protein A2J03_06945 [Rhodococcus sp. EPR-157]